MIAGIGLGVLLVLVFGLLTALARAHELYCVSVRKGRSLVVRGTLPFSVQLEIERLLAGSDDVLIRTFEREGEIRVEASGVTEAEDRALTKLLGTLGSEDLPPVLPRDKTWGRFLGFVALAWWLNARNRDDGPEDPPDDPGPPKPPSNVIPFRK